MATRLRANSLIHVDDGGAIDGGVLEERLGLPDGFWDGDVAWLQMRRGRDLYAAWCLRLDSYMIGSVWFHQLNLS